jgi:signal transduction histidine kinase
MSLERKIILSFLISLTLIAVLAGASAVNFLEIRKGIAHLELSDTLRSKTLQLRRHEKNYFLYGEAKERDQVHAFLDDLTGTLRAPGPLTGSPELAALAGLLDGYRSGFDRIEALGAGFRVQLRRLLPEHPGAAPSAPLIEAVLLERPLVNAELLATVLSPAEARPLATLLSALDAEIGALRHSGDQLLTLSSDLDRDARVRVERALVRSRNAALVLFPLSLLVGLGSLFAIGHSVVGRLKLLTAVIEKTGKGDFTPFALPAGDDEVGTLVGAVNTMERELAAREQVIAEKNEELLQSRKLAAIGTLASGVAHELNNPLNNISLAAQILAREIPPEGAAPIVRETVDDILSQTQRVKRIVGDLLEFAREKPPELRPADLGAIVREAATRTVPAGVALALAAPDEVRVMADSHLLTQVFVNLIANAVEATGGSGRLAVTVERRGGRAVAVVSDSGGGISPANLTKIFDPFFTTKERGTGLGLAIVYNTVSTHGGTVEVASRPGEGTTFTVSLPAIP